MLDGFGTSVAIDHDTLLVGAFAPSRIGIGPSLPRAYVFYRRLGGQSAWDAVATLPMGSGGANEDPVPAAVVSLSADTAIVGNRRLGPAFGLASIFQRDQGGPNVWGEVAALPLQDPSISGVSISGDLAAASDLIRPGTGSDTGVTVFARHQGGTNAWGEVQRIHVPQPQSLAMSGDTILLGNATAGSTQRTPIDVYVGDTDRDGIRDGVDACPRDPLNNEEGRCTRNGSAYLVLDNLLTLGNVATATHGNEFHITGTFTNTSDTSIGNPFFEVTDLTGDNLLLNADAGPGGLGATLSPDVGDGILSPGESTTVTCVVGLATRNAFQFHVSAKGDPSQ
jgi:hypothetical protein